MKKRSGNWKKSFTSMRKPNSMNALESLGRVRLSPSFFMRDFLYSEISNFHGIPNIPDNPDLAIEVGKQLCKNLLEPLQRTFGRIAIRSAYRSCSVNEFGNKHKLNCASNEANYAGHIWDRLDADGHKGATACIVIPWFTDRFQQGADWRSMAWWIHDHLPYSSLEFFPSKGPGENSERGLCAFNISWHEKPKKTIYSFIEPKGWLTKPGMDNHNGSHAEYYRDFPALEDQ